MLKKGETLFVILIMLQLWIAHGLDVQYYAMDSPYMFEVQLMMFVLITFMYPIVLYFIDHNY